MNYGDYDKRTPLHIAASANNVPIINALLGVPNINVNPIDNFDMTPYHDAISNNHTEVAAVLKQYSGVIVHRDLGYKLCNAGYEGDLAQL